MVLWQARRKMMLKSPCRGRSRRSSAKKPTNGIVVAPRRFGDSFGRGWLPIGTESKTANRPRLLARLQLSRPDRTSRGRPPRIKPMTMSKPGDQTDVCSDRHKNIALFSSFQRRDANIEITDIPHNNRAVVDVEGQPGEWLTPDSRYVAGLEGVR